MMRLALAAFAMLAPVALGEDLCASGSTNATATPDLTQGPFHITEQPELFRSNVTEGQAGIPLHLEITVLDTSCTPVTNALVEIWNANATGYYSGVIGQTPAPGEGAGGVQNEYTTFLRGAVEVSDIGVASFDTIMPGRYSGRAVHTHYAVHIPTVDEANTESALWNSSHVTHIGQIFYADNWTDAAHLYWPYSTVSNQGVTYLEEDMVFEDSNDDPRVICDFQPVDALDLDAGATATIQSIVDLASTDAFMGDYITGTNYSAAGQGGSMAAGGPMPSGTMNPSAGLGMGAGGPMPGSQPGVTGPGGAGMPAGTTAGR